MVVGLLLGYSILKASQEMARSKKSWFDRAAGAAAAVIDTGFCQLEGKDDPIL